MDVGPPEVGLAGRTSVMAPDGPCAREPSFRARLGSRPSSGLVPAITPRRVNEDSNMPPLVVKG